jgi:uncharacterized protein (DUF302 family)
MMIPDPADGPPRLRNAAGIVSITCSHPVEETLNRLTRAISAAGATLFAVINQSEQASTAGLSLRDTRLVIFGSPAAGTAVVTAAPLAAIDLPLKILIWQDDLGAVWASFLDADWLAVRHRLPAALARPLRAACALATEAASP